ncbi:MAG: hypothetical protein ACI35W_03425 [Anaeroplasmataceae bacterium]
MNTQKIKQTSDIVIEVIQVFGELDLSNILKELILNEDNLDV